MTPILIFTSFLATLIAIVVFRRFTGRTSALQDVPNERSSHSQPVIRGAGIAVVLTVIIAYLLVSGSNANWSWVLTAFTIAAIGFWDDVRSLPALFRLLVHIAAATAFVWLAGPFPGIADPSGNYDISFGEAAPIISVVLIVAIINAYNFMDGIDGIAGAQGMGTALGWLILGISTNVAAYSDLSSILLGSCGAFLVFNWQPAKVFLGDVGSTFLGFTLATIPLIDNSGSAGLGGRGLFFVCLFLSLFLFDTIYTRIRQIAARRAFWKPHREHIYQQLVISGAEHWQVSAFFGVSSILVAIATLLSPWAGFGGALIACSVLLLWKKTLT